MDKQRRKELLEKYNQIKIYIGVVQIKNNINGKICIASYPNLKNKWLNIQNQLDMGRYPNLQLQREWKELGPNAFSYEVLEQKSNEDITDVRWELKQMEKSWIEKLQPFEERGYNKRPTK